MSDTPVTPRPAATILLLRRGARHGDRGFEVLLVRRSAGASFMPGVWVFPGGSVEEGETAAECALRELAEEASVEVAEATELVEWMRWITPEVVPVRFDTVFFVAIAPAHAKPSPDQTEVSEVGWFAPQAALDAHGSGDLDLVFPTIKTLEMMVGHRTPEDLLEAARSREDRPILPRVIGTRADHRIVLPWEDGYEDATDYVRGLPE